MRIQKKRIVECGLEIALVIFLIKNVANFSPCLQWNEGWSAFAYVRDDLLDAPRLTGLGTSM